MVPLTATFATLV